MARPRMREPALSYLSQLPVPLPKFKDLQSLKKFCRPEAQRFFAQICHADRREIVQENDSDFQKVIVQLKHFYFINKVLKCTVTKKREQAKPSYCVINIFTKGSHILKLYNNITHFNHANVNKRKHLRIYKRYFNTWLLFQIKIEETPSMKWKRIYSQLQDKVQWSNNSKPLCFNSYHFCNNVIEIQAHFLSS